MVTVSNWCQHILVSRVRPTSLVANAVRQLHSSWSAPSCPCSVCWVLCCVNFQVTVMAGTSAGLQHCISAGTFLGAHVLPFPFLFFLFFPTLPSAWLGHPKHSFRLHSQPTPLRHKNQSPRGCHALIISPFAFPRVSLQSRIMVCERFLHVALLS